MEANKKQGIVGWLFFRNEKKDYPLKMIPFCGSKENYRKATKELRTRGKQTEVKK